MTYTVLRNLRANGIQYRLGDKFPASLKEVDYKDLVDSSYLKEEKVAAAPKPAKAKPKNNNNYEQPQEN